jgi:hypothetical protein
VGNARNDANLRAGVIHKKKINEKEEIFLRFSWQVLGMIGGGVLATAK